MHHVALVQEAKRAEQAVHDFKHVLFLELHISFHYLIKVSVNKIQHQTQVECVIILNQGRIFMWARSNSAICIFGINAGCGDIWCDDIYEFGYKNSADPIEAPHKLDLPYKFDSVIFGLANILQDFESYKSASGLAFALVDSTVTSFAKFLENSVFLLNCGL